MTVIPKKMNERFMPLHIQLATGDIEGVPFRAVLSEPPGVLIVEIGEETKERWQYSLKDIVQDAYSHHRMENATETCKTCGAEYPKGHDWSEHVCER